MRFKKLWLFYLIVQNIPICLYSQENINEKKDPAKSIAIAIQKKEEAASLQKMIFINARVNDIVLEITHEKNQTVKIPLKRGCHYEYYFKHPILKIVCYEKLTPKTIMHKADTQTYKVFVFNDSQKTDKFHHISIREKNKALKLARQLGNISLFNDVCEETIYKL